VTKARANDNEGVTASQALQQVRAASAAVKKLGRSVTEKVQGTVQGQAAASPPAPESEKKAAEQ
jgi:hypothetical protein